MSVKDRKAREQAQRRTLIVASARQLAETEGWDAVTTRRLADVIEYSQPVLYQHFPNKDAIVQAVALQGFSEMAQALRTGRERGGDPRQNLLGLIHAYLEFAAANPVLYQAMFILTVDLDFASGQSPEALIEAFGEIIAAVTPLATDHEPETLAEVVWCGCHGLATLSRTHRLRPPYQEQRIAMLADSFVGPAS